MTIIWIEHVVHALLAVVSPSPACSNFGRKIVEASRARSWPRTRSARSTWASRREDSLASRYSAVRAWGTTLGHHLCHAGDHHSPPSTAISRRCSVRHSLSTRANPSAIIGANGAGKSTSLKAINVLLPRPAAAVRLDGGDFVRRRRTTRGARRRAGSGRPAAVRFAFGRGNLLVGAYGRRTAARGTSPRSTGFFPFCGSGV